MGTKIEWTNEKSVIPMLIDMALRASGSYIKQMCVSVAMVMMVLACFLAAIKAWKAIRFSQPTFFNGISNSVRRFLSMLHRWRQIFSLYPNFNTPTCLAGWIEFVSATIVCVKQKLWLPAFTFVAPLKTFLYLLLVSLKRNSYSFGSDFLCTCKRTHNNLLNWYNYTQRILICQEQKYNGLNFLGIRCVVVRR